MFRTTLLFLFAALLLGACKKSVDRSGKIRIGQCATRSVDGTGVKICFESLVQDSRCPMNMMCITAGEAIVRLKLEAGGEQRTVDLSTRQAPPHSFRDTVLLGLKWSLRNVSPYPGDNSTQPYSIELEVSK